MGDKLVGQVFQVGQSRELVGEVNEASVGLDVANIASLHQPNLYNNHSEQFTYFQVSQQTLKSVMTSM